MKSITAVFYDRILSTGATIYNHRNGFSLVPFQAHSIPAQHKVGIHTDCSCYILLNSFFPLKMYMLVLIFIMHVLGRIII